jgi:hypothetical protein
VASGLDQKVIGGALCHSIEQKEAFEIQERLFHERLGFPGYEELKGEFFDRTFRAGHGSTKVGSFGELDFESGAAGWDVCESSGKIAWGLDREFKCLGTEVFQMKVPFSIGPGGGGRGISFEIRDPFSCDCGSWNGVVVLIEDMARKDLFGLEDEIDFESYRVPTRWAVNGS